MMNLKLPTSDLSQLATTLPQAINAFLQLQSEMLDTQKKLLEVTAGMRQTTEETERDYHAVRLWLNEADYGIATPQRMRIVHMVASADAACTLTLYAGENNVIDRQYLSASIPYEARWSMADGDPPDVARGTRVYARASGAAHLNVWLDVLTE